MDKIKTVIFDMDGLMFDTEKIYYQTNQSIADELQLDYTKETYANFVGAGYHQEYNGMLELYKDEALIKTYYEKTGNILKDVLRNGPIDIMPGLLELLAYLKETDIPMIVASSTHRELVEHMLDRLRVRDYFVDVVGGDEVEFAKPDPAIFNKAFSKTSLKNKNEALVLEDSKNGIIAAYDAGIPVVLVPNMVDPDTEMKEKTAAILPDLHAVKTYIEKINA